MKLTGKKLKLLKLAKLSTNDVDELFKTFSALFGDFVKEHHEPPRISFFIFSRLVPIGKTYMARPAGMWGALTLDEALEAATRQYPLGEKVFLRLDFVLPDLPP